MTNSKLKNDAATVAERASTLSKDVRELGAAAKRTVASSADVVRETAGDYLEQGRNKARQAGEDIQNKVGERPITSLLIASAIGFIVGAIWMRR